MYFIGAILKRTYQLTKKPSLSRDTHTYTQRTKQIDSQQKATVIKFDVQQKRQLSHIPTERAGSVYKMSDLRAIRKPWVGEQPYHPDDLDERYLDQSFLSDIWHKIDNGTSKSQDIFQLIKEHEHIHETYVQGKISKQKEINMVEKLFNAFYKKHKSWPHQEPTYHRFYYELNNGNW
ncbi:hypothetical protein LC040_04935 [Bacillus tianshenii]|nr:hypothetical protein LC040_04935 [Bacillus tianshenii]